MKRQEYELMLLHYISEEFTVMDAKFDAFIKKNKGKKTVKKKLEEAKELGKVKREA